MNSHRSADSTSLTAQQGFTNHGPLDALKTDWMLCWEHALACWSRYTRLSAPRWCYTPEDEAREGLSGSFAIIRLSDHAVVVSLRMVQSLGLEAFPLEILAHEIGHHVYCPADLSDNGRLLARIRAGLVNLGDQAPMISNLYTDLLINDRLHHQTGLRMDGVYQALQSDGKSELWCLYMRIYEILWGLPSGTLTHASPAPELEADAWLGNRLIRHYARDWIEGAGSFAALCLPYLLRDLDLERVASVDALLDAIHATGDSIPDGLTTLETGELEGARHPILDPNLQEVRRGDADPDEHPVGEQPRPMPAPGGKGRSTGSGNGRAQLREPFEYGELLKGLGITLSEQEVAIRYYRERAIPHLIPFPTRPMPRVSEPHPEGLDPWDVGERLEAVDWLETLLRSPIVIPGLTTVQRTAGEATGAEPARQPIDLDLYVDSSGSMPNPQLQTSYLTLAGAIISLSALRAGSLVQATLWSGANQFVSTRGFVKDESAILEILTGFLGGCTAFPIHLLRDTFEHRSPGDRHVHVLIISDDGVTTLFDRDERHNSGWDISRLALERGGAGGTMLLNLPYQPDQFPDLKRAAQQGWQLYRVTEWDELLTMARAFSRQHYHHL